jgi:alpha-tubulin suppressor-like RCC1 family protein
VGRRWTFVGLTVATLASMVSFVAAPTAVAAVTPKTTPAGTTLTSDGSSFVGVSPARLLDTRPGFATIDGQGRPGAPMHSNVPLSLQITGRAGVPSIDVGAVLVNVTVVNPKSSGFLTVSPFGLPTPQASNLNFTSGQIVANQVLAKIGEGGKISLVSTALTTDVVVDLLGYFPTDRGVEPVVPARLLDTRPGYPTVDGQGTPGTPLGSNSTVNVAVVGRGGVPSTGVGSVILNVTAIDPTAPGFITVWPTGSPMPNASNLNTVPGQIVPNLVVAQVGTGGMVSIHRSFGASDMVVDVLGWSSSVHSGLDSLVPARLLDTRPGFTTIDGQGTPGAKLGPNASITLQVNGRGGVPATGVGAVVLNVTAANSTASSFITAWPTGATMPNASNLNFVPGSIVPNLVTVPTGTNGQVSFHNQSGSTDLIVDVEGWFEAGGQSPSTIVVPNTTKIIASSDVTGITGDSTDGGTVTLGPGVDIPPIGDTVVLNSSPAYPDGFMGIVSVIITNQNGTTTLTTTSTTLNDAFTSIDATYSGPVGVDPSANPPSELDPAVEIPHNVTSQASQASFGFDFANAGIFTCQGEGSTTPSISVQFEDTQTTLKIDTTAKLDPMISGEIQTEPVITVSAGAEGGLTCSVNTDEVDKISIPIPEGPLELTFQVTPILSFSIDGSGQVSQTIHLLRVFSFTASPNAGIHPSGGGRVISTSPQTNAEAVSFSISAGVEISLLAYDAVGVAIDIYGKISANYDITNGDVADGCLTATAELDGSLNLTATAWGFAHFAYSIASITDGPWRLGTTGDCSNATFSIATSTLPNAKESHPYTTTLQTSGGTAPVRWSIIHGSLPSNLALNASTGVISGTPDSGTAGAYPVTLSATDANNNSASTTLDLDVDYPDSTGPLTIETSFLQNAVDSLPYDNSLEAIGGTGPYTWSIISGSLPPGLSLSSSGEITGTPKNADGPGGATIQVKVLDSSQPPESITETFNLVVDPPPFLDDIRNMASDGASVCALLKSGGVDCWGSNKNGDLGDGATTVPPSSPIPVAVPGISNAVQITAVGGGIATFVEGTDFRGGGYCAVLSTGGIDCWGVNPADWVFNDADVSSVPTPLSGVSTATSLTTNLGGACALLLSGGVDCMGGDDVTGDSGTGSSSTMVPVPSLTNAVSLASNGEGMCAVLATSGVDCWGRPNSPGRADEEGAFESVPTPIPGLGGVDTLVDDWNAECALLSSGLVKCWGDGEHGELGDGPLDFSSTPVTVTGLSGATSLVAGGDGFCAVFKKVDNTIGVDCWGANGTSDANNDGTNYPIWTDLGTGGTASSDVPVQVSGISNVASVTSDYAGYCATLIGGTVSCWGRNDLVDPLELADGSEFGGALGDGALGDQSTPTAVSNLSDVGSTFEDGSGYCALDTNGAAACWGNNVNLELGGGDPFFDGHDLTALCSLVPVAVAPTDFVLNTDDSGLPSGAYSPNCVDDPGST